MMEDSTITALEDVLRRVQAGHFHSQYDAMCLASVELENASATPENVRFTTPPGEVRPVRGLQGLCSEVLGILNSALVAEQAPLAFLQQQLQALRCSVLEGTSTSALESSEEKSVAGVAAGTKTLPTDWNVLPPAADEVPLPPPIALSSERGALLQPSSLVLSTRSAVHRRLQPLYDEAFSLIAVKTRALELIDALFAVYEADAARLATAGGLKHTTARAQYMIQPCLLDLLSHRFLDATEVCN